ncbi:FAD/NAD(P)-binding protein [Terriglobus albidus]|uniref:FAD/NAD(P)-binding protein n=1 Tax=Terriglobus albidus TaxID=1592106 RepID=UPI0021DFE671|nr:FAD/NAD(P)-binding protein [Terriglobus albidus]
MDTQETATAPIAIVGGGVSGALTAYHLIRQNPKAFVVLVDSSPSLGLGLAYATPSYRHLLNVPAGRMSALPDEPDHFLKWLRANHDPQAGPMTPTSMTFAPRAVFGRYIQSLLASVSQIEHLSAKVVDLKLTRKGAILTCHDGRTLEARAVVLALGNFDPAPLPGIAQQALTAGVYRHNAWAADAFVGLDPQAPVTLIGTGLTGVDVLLRLRELGHTGTITAVSRHGIFPQRHAAYTALQRSAIPRSTPATCLAYLRAFRQALRNGAEWRAAIDSLRATTNELWLALPVQEQGRFRRHLQRRWDVARHRMAPAIADIVDAELRAGTLRIRKGGLQSVDLEGERASVTIRTAEGTQSFETSRVINCTGPSTHYRQVGSPLLASLFAQGIIADGPLGGGFRTSPSGAVIDAAGQESALLFSVGPGRLGTLLESIAIPEIRTQAAELAHTLHRMTQQTEAAPHRAATLYTADPIILVPSGAVA